MYRKHSEFKPGMAASSKWCFLIKFQNQNKCEKVEVQRTAVVQLCYYWSTVEHSICNQAKILLSFHNYRVLPET
jgi:hypothetical protein